MSVLFPSSPPAPPSPAVQSVPASSGPPSWNSIDPVPRPSPPQAAPGATAFNTAVGLGSPPPKMTQVYKGVWIGSHTALQSKLGNGCAMSFSHSGHW